VRFEWPPSVAAINQYGARIIAGLVIPTLALLLKLNIASPSEKEKQWQEEELERKQVRLRDMIERVSEFLKKNPEDDAEDLKIRFVDMYHCCRDVLQLDQGCKALASGLDLTSRLLSKELAHATVATKKGVSSKFKNGERLKELLNYVRQYERLLDTAHLERSQLQPLFSSMRRIWKQYREARRVLRIQLKDDIFAALRLISMARSNIIVLLGASAMSALGGMLEALDILYKSESLEMLRRPNWQWSNFITNVRGWLTLRMMRTFLDLLIGRVRVIGQQGMEQHLRTKLYASMLRQDFEWYRLGQRDERDVHSIFGQIFKIPDQVKGFIGGFTAMVEIAVSAVSQAVIIRQRSNGLLYAMVALEWGSLILGHIVKWIENWAQSRMERGAVSVDLKWIEPLIPENLPTVRASAAERRTLQNWDMFWRYQLRKDNRKSVVSFLAFPASMSVIHAQTLGSYVWAGHLIRSDKVNVDDFEALGAMSGNIAKSFRSLLGAFWQSQENYVPLARSWEVVSAQPTIGLDGGDIPGRKALGTLSFEDVEFKYPDGPQVLKGITFTAEAGMTCAITGTSGSGKSTIFKLITRFYDPEKGAILLDGIDIRTLNPVWARRQIGLVEQKPRIFSLTVKENLIFGCARDPTLQEIEEACRGANIYDFIFNNKEKFPAGLYSNISQDTLSGGELQRIAIARAFLRDAPILLLDEATSSLDSFSQTAVKHALKKLMHGRTVVTIAHRLETIKDSDSILFIKKGKVCEKGTHADLVNAGGHYAELYQQQVTETIVKR